MKYTFDYEHAELADLSPADAELIAAAREQTQNAYAPYSNFKVGAAARLKSGKILRGSNQESEVFPSGLCAERTLLFHWGACHAQDPIEALAIASNPSERECYPCAGCRQVLLDMERRQGQPIRIIMSSATSATAVDSAEKLLPFSFIL